MFFENKLLDYVRDNNGKNILLTKIIYIIIAALLILGLSEIDFRIY